MIHKTPTHKKEVSWWNHWVVFTIQSTPLDLYINIDFGVINTQVPPWTHTSSPSNFITVSALRPQPRVLPTHNLHTTPLPNASPCPPCHTQSAYTTATEWPKKLKHIYLCGYMLVGRHTHTLFDLCFPLSLITDILRLVPFTRTFCLSHIWQANKQQQTDMQTHTCAQTHADADTWSLQGSSSSVFWFWL